MDAQMVAVLLIPSVLALVLSAWGLVYSKAADEFAAKCHTRMNGVMDKYTRLVNSSDLSSRGLQRRVDKLDREVFGTGRSGIYPDMGLRDWGRNWRGRLRDDVATLHEQMAIHSHPSEAPEVSRLDIESLDKRIDTVSELRYLNGRELAQAREAHNRTITDLAKLVDTLGLEYRDGEFLKKPRRTKKG